MESMIRDIKLAPSGHDKKFAWGKKNFYACTSFL